MAEKKKIILTGGGTAGHVTPHLALIPKLQEKGYEIHYFGTEDGIEHTMINRLDGVTYHSVKSGKLRRYHDWKNFTDPFRVLAGAFEAKREIKKLRPDVCFSKGGFVAVPVVWGAWRAHVPILCHESDLTPGLANKLSARFATRIVTTFPECAEALGPKAEMVGTPMRPELFAGNRETGRKIAGFSDDKPILLMTGGSLGAQSINKVLRESLEDLLPQMNIIHICGKGNLDQGLLNTPGYAQFEFVTEELPHLFAAADAVLSRAGSNSLCELQALKKPMLLIPYPMGASRGDQILNAESYRKRGLALVLSQDQMNRETLVKSIQELFEKKDQLISALNNAPTVDGTDRVLELIEEIQKTRK